MAARHAIHFPISVQLRPRLTSPSRRFRWACISVPRSTSSSARSDQSDIIDEWRKSGSGLCVPPKLVPGHQYRALKEKVIDWVEHEFEEGLLYIHIRFTDKTELCWRITTRMTIERSDLADWTSGDFKQLAVFVRNERDRSV